LLGLNISDFFFEAIYMISILQVNGKSSLRISSLPKMVFFL